MSLPIAATPPLSGKAAREFLRRVKEKENIPFGPVPTPKIDEAIERVMKDARNAETRKLKNIWRLWEWLKRKA